MFPVGRLLLLLRGRPGLIGDEAVGRIHNSAGVPHRHPGNPRGEFHSTGHWIGEAVGPGDDGVEEALHVRLTVRQTRRRPRLAGRRGFTRGCPAHLPGSCERQRQDHDARPESHPPSSVHLAAPFRLRRAWPDRRGRLTCQFLDTDSISRNRSRSIRSREPGNSFPCGDTGSCSSSRVS